MMFKEFLEGVYMCEWCHVWTPKLLVLDCSIETAAKDDVTPTNLYAFIFLSDAS